MPHIQFTHYPIFILCLSKCDILTAETAVLRSFMKNFQYMFYHFVEEKYKELE